MMSFFKVGEKGLKISLTLHQENRKKIVDRLKENNLSSDSQFILLQGGSDTFRGGSDTEDVFRQESYFHYLFGVLEPDFYGAIRTSDGMSILFAPKLSPNALIYMGRPKTLEDYKNYYMVDHVYYVEEIKEQLISHKAETLLTLHGLNTDSGNFTVEANFDGIKHFKVDSKLLHPLLSECRVIKSEKELEIIKYCNDISSAAHRNLMRSIKPNDYQYQAEALFHYHCYNEGGMRHVSYTCISASGCECATLHYGHAGAPNSNKIVDGDMVLFDMGGEYYCYCSDITCSWPVNGKFTDKQKIIYQAVYDATQAVLKALRPGVLWTDMHVLAERMILKALLDADLLRGDLDELIKIRMGAVFMPHGIGHLMGCDTHDVGGYNPGQPSRPSDKGLKNLRTARPIMEGMVLTVEPGCYFIEMLLNNAKEDAILNKFINWDKIEDYKSFGGVRIEENVYITKDGHHMLTNVPRTIEEIESWMAGGRFRQFS